MDMHERIGALLPKPRQVTATEGFCRCDRDVRLVCDGVDPRIERAFARWVEERRAAVVEGGSHRVANTSRFPPLSIFAHRDSSAAIADAHPQGYRVEIRPERIRVTARNDGGCWYALQTLRRLVRRERDGVAVLPCCRIDDWPDFATRGLLLDITRGRVPTLARLKSLVDRLASLKINQLQLYIEHAFVFSFDPDICDSESGVTPEEVRELDGYCRERFVELVPAVATFGHMGRILSLPQYRHLAEIEPPRPWEEMDWPRRARGFTLDVANPEAHRLVERIWSEVFEAFSSPVVNICGDEPWDLGRGRNAGRWDDRRRGEVYLEQIGRTHAFCASRGRKVMFWSDVVVNHGDLFDRVPRDAVVLHWGYDDRADYAGTSRLVEAGLRTWVCPGTSGWKRIINALDLAERNITAFARTGAACGASGLLNTDWGDHGHFSLPAGSWPAIVLGASLAWSTNQAIGPPFDDVFARVEWSQVDGAVVHALREASALAADCETWRMLWMPIERLAGESTWPSMDAIEAMRVGSIRAERLIQSARRATSVDAEALAELELACRFSQLCADKLSIARHRRGDLGSNEKGSSPALNWADRLRACAVEYADLWRTGYKESGLRDILKALEAAAADLLGAERP